MENKSVVVTRHCLLYASRLARVCLSSSKGMLPKGYGQILMNVSRNVDNRPEAND